MYTLRGLVKINLRQIKTAYLVGGILFAGVIATIIQTFVAYHPDNKLISSGDYLFIVPILAAILIPARNYGKSMNLGARRMEWYKASLVTYIIIVIATVAAGLLLRYTLDAFMTRRVQLVYGMYEAFGFIRRGPVPAFLQMSVFMLLFCITLHSLTLAQSFWYGWVIDVLIVAVISVFTPIPYLRGALVWFFRQIIFHDYAIVQILSCLILGGAIYAASIIPLKNKHI